MLKNKDQIIQEIVDYLYEDHFKPKELEFSVKLHEAVTLLYNLITISIGEDELDGLTTTFFEAVSNFYDADLAHQRIYINDIATSSDAVIKKILFFTCPPKYHISVASKWMLKKLIEEIGILRSNNFSILWDTPTLVTDISGFPTYLQTTYKTRNKVHEAKDWKAPQLSDRFIACLMTFVYLVLDNYTNLQSGIDAFVKQKKDSELLQKVDMKQYLTQVEDRIKIELTKRFIELEMSEQVLIDNDIADRDIEEVWEDDEEHDGDWIESEEEEETDENWNEADEDEEEPEEYEPMSMREKRKGKISELRKDIPLMMIRGRPGMGKTTTLRYLALCDAQNRQPVPFLFYLKGYLSSKGSLLTQIAKTGQFESKWLEQYLEAGNGSLYLDGLNEIIDPSEREKLKTEIEGLARFCKNMVVSSREKAYDTDRFKIPVFDLKPLDAAKIMEYVDKVFGNRQIVIEQNGQKQPYTSETFIQLLQKIPKLYALFQNPFFLRMYMDVVRQTHSFPQNTGLLLRIFIKGSTQKEQLIGGLFWREQRKPDKTHWIDNRKKYEDLIEYLAYETRYNNQLAIGRREAIEILAMPNQKYFGGSVDLDRFLSDFTDLHLLEENNGLLSFTHELYQEYFAAESLTHKYKQDDTLIEILTDNSNWLEPLILFDGLLQSDVTTFKRISGVNSETGARILESSIELQPEKREINLQDALNDARNFAYSEASARGFMALLYLGEFEKIVELMQEVKNPYPEHKKVMNQLAQRCNAKQVYDFLWAIKDVGGSARHLLDWFIKGIERDFAVTGLEQQYISLLTYWTNKIKYENIAFNLCTKVQFVFLMPETTVFELIVIKAIETNQLHYAEHWIKKYQLQEKFSLETIIEKAIEKNQFQLAEYWIKKYQFQEKFPIETIIEKALNKNIFLAKVWIERYQLHEKFPIETIIEKAIETNQLELAKNWIDKFNLQDKYSIENLIEKAIEAKQPYLAFRLMKYNDLVSEYDLEKLISIAMENGELAFAHRCIEEWGLVSKYNMEDFILNSIKSNQLILAAQLIEKHELSNKFPFTILLEIAEQNGTKKIYDYLFSNFYLKLDNNEFNKKIKEFIANKLSTTISYDLINSSQFDAKDIMFLVDKSLKNKQLHLAMLLIEKLQPPDLTLILSLFQLTLKESNFIMANQLIDLYGLDKGLWVKCKVVKLLNKHIHVKVEDDDRLASIYIRELANHFIPDIFQFEYNGVKLHIGQVLRARIIGEDEKGRVHLSLIGVPPI